MELQITELILLGILAACFIIQIIYYLGIYFKPYLYQKKVYAGKIKTSHALPSVSVIITARDCAEEINKYLPAILEQDYPDYEVIFVNDGSKDETKEAIEELSTRYKNLYHTYVPTDAMSVSRKKLALNLGIKAATKDILLFTEINCELRGNEWIRNMVKNFNDGTELVLGFTNLNRFGFMSSYAGYDNLVEGLRYLSRAVANKPYKGVNSNLAYRKSVYFNNKGYSHYLKLRPGEDDLFVKENATSTNTKVELSAITLNTLHLLSTKSWKEVKIAQAATRKYYKLKEKIRWNTEYITRYLFYAAAIFSIIYYWYTIYIPAVAGGLILLRLIIQWIVINKSAKMFHTEKFYLSLPFFDLLQPVNDLYFSMKRFFRSRKDLGLR